MNTEISNTTEDDEILELFLEESVEHLESIEADLLSIEKLGESVDLDKVNKVFRAIHTIKGGAGFFGLTKVKDLTHVTENMLDLIRKEKLTPNREVVQCLFSSIDTLNEMFNKPQEMEEFEVKSIVVSINRTIAESNVKSDDELNTSIAIKNKAEEVIFETTHQILEESSNSLKGGENFFLLRYDLNNESEKEEKLNSLKDFCDIIENKMEGGETFSFYVLVSTVVEADLAGSFFELDEKQISIIQPEAADSDTETAPEVKDLPQEETVQQTDSYEQEDNKTDQAEVMIDSQAEKVQDAEKAANFKSPTKTENLRVNLHLLENLMTIAGELVLARNQLVQALSVDDHDKVKSSASQIDLVTSQLQEAIMKTRMQPVGKTFSKFKRIVRDLSADLNKKVELEIEGESVEIDKTIIESINDPLTHIIRNSMDHGLETPEERLAAGKNAEGKLEIKAYHETGKVIIAINDDGRGIDTEKVGQKALEKGLISNNDLMKMSEKELTNLIFKPGFSTNDEVTEISGRGVGMDVVLTNLNKLGGVVDLNSTPGKGTQLKISLPLTLAIMPSLLVSACETTLAIPQVNLIQIVRVPTNEISTQMQHIGDSLVIRFMDELIPVVRAEDFLEENVSQVDFHQKNFGFSKPLHVVVVAAGEFKYGIIVDETLESPEIVVKALGRNLQPLKIYSGATILGDGTIAPIIDVQGIMQEMKLNAVDSSHVQKESAEGVRQSDLQQLLIVNNGHVENFALMLNSVLRVERIECSDIKQVGSTRSCDIGGKSIALFSMDDAADVSPLEIKGTLSVIMFEVLGRHVGLLAKEIVDSVEVQTDFEEFPHKQPGIFGSTYINDKLCMLVDTFSLVSSQKPQWVEDSEVYSPSTEKDCDILVVDDSKFFLNQITSFLEEAGYSVVEAEDGSEALERLKAPENNIKLVLTDIEMPVMDGWELTKEIRSDERWEKLPLIAVTSVSGSSAREKGKALGIDEYLIKLDREEIIMNLQKYLHDDSAKMAG